MGGGLFDRCGRGWLLSWFILKNLSLFFKKRSDRALFVALSTQWGLHINISIGFVKAHVALHKRRCDRSLLAALPT